MIPARLQQAVSDLADTGATAKITVRELLRWFGVNAPGHYATLRVRETLKRLSVTTDPDFGTVPLDAQIQLTRDDLKPESVSAQPNELLDSDPAYRIGNIESARRVPTSVPPSTLVQDAITTMIHLGFSQLPVMLGRGRVFGMLTWKSLAITQHFRPDVGVVSDAMEPHHEILATRSVFDAIPVILEHEYVLVRDSTNYVSGIVTASDLGGEFRTLAEPFMLVREIENYLRRLLSRRLGPSALSTMGDPRNARNVESIEDLSLGEMIRFLQAPENWDLLNIPLGHQPFLNSVAAIGRIRNDIMHFRSTSIPEGDLRTLRDTGKFWRSLGSANFI